MNDDIASVVEELPFDMLYAWIPVILTVCMWWIVFLFESSGTQAYRRPQMYTSATTSALGACACMGLCTNFKNGEVYMLCP